MWIDQPSGLQSYHHLHGTNVLWDEKDETAYFTSGDIVSMQLPKIVLSEGWRPESKIKQLADGEN